MPQQKPTSATIRMYNVGFGDCTLLTFHYQNLDDRHLLLDFGSKRGPGESYTNRLKKVAEHIKGICGNKLHAVVASHRHKDHIQGFMTGEEGDKPGDIIKKLKPEVVIQPWTERPNAKVDYQGPKSLLSSKRDKSIKKPTLSQRTASYLSTLDNMQDFAGYVLDFSNRRKASLPVELRKRLEFLGEGTVKNDNPVKNLIEMSKGKVKGKKRGRYVYAGSKLNLKDQFPGVTFTVLGPPTLKQHADIRKAAKKSDEYWPVSSLWALRKKALENVTTHEPRPLFAPRFRYRNGYIPTHARPIVDSVQKVYSDELASIVTECDRTLNNTSVILLIEAFGYKLLFSGDAQKENWEYSLEKEENENIMTKLSEVDVYHVGHHGSFNATPKTLWNNFAYKGEATDYQLLSLLNTVTPNSHGKIGNDYKIPRKSLLEDLKKETALVNTDDWQDDTLFEPYEISWE